MAMKCMHSNYISNHFLWFFLMNKHKFVIKSEIALNTFRKNILFQNMIIALPFALKFCESTNKNLIFLLQYFTSQSKIKSFRIDFRGTACPESQTTNYRFQATSKCHTSIYSLRTPTFFLYGRSLKYFGWHFAQMSFPHECLCFEGKGSSLESIQEISLNDSIESIWIFSGMSQITGVWVKHLDNVFIMQESFSVKDRQFKVIDRFNSNAERRGGQNGMNLRKIFLT